MLAQKQSLVLKVIGVIIALMVPFFLLMFSVRVLLTPAFARFEYNLPHFPEDEFGFTKEDRLRYSEPSIRYLTNDAGIEYLAELTLEDNSPLYNDRELSHMQDVKDLVQAALKGWYIVTGVMGVFALSAKALGGWLDFRRALGYGGWLTLGSILLGGAAIAINFDWLFTEFHHLFFEGDTWLFYTSDSLIRLFPEKFWMDAFILAFVITIAGALLLILQQWKLKNKQSKVE